MAEAIAEATSVDDLFERLVAGGRLLRLSGDIRPTILNDGTIPTGPRKLHVDCSADGLENRPAVPVFDGMKLTLQALSRCQQGFSSAFTAHVEATYADDAVKNDLCLPIPHPDSDLDWLRRRRRTATTYAGPRMPNYKSGSTTHA